MACTAFSLKIVVVQSLSPVWLSCDSMDYSQPAFSVHGICQARILEWVAISSIRGSSQRGEWTCISCIGRQILYRLATGEAKKAMATHSSTLAWKIPWTEEPGRLQSMGSPRVRHDWVTSLSLSCIGEGNGNQLQCSCLENPRDGGAWWAAVYGVPQSQTQLKRLSSSSSTGEACVL